MTDNFINIVQKCHILVKLDYLMYNQSFVFIYSTYPYPRWQTQCGYQIYENRTFLQMIFMCLNFVPPLLNFLLKNLKLSHRNLKEQLFLHKKKYCFYVLIQFCHFCKPKVSIDSNYPRGK